MEQIDLRPKTVDTGIDLSLPAPILSEEVATEQARKYEIALGDNSPGYSTLYNQLLAGQEDAVRRSAALNKSLDVRKVQQQLIQEYSRAKGGDPLSQADYDFISSLTYEQLVNPETILEKEYAREVTNKLYGDSLVMRDAFQESPEVSDVLLDVTEQTIAKRELAQKELRKLDAEWGKSGWLTPDESSWAGAVGTFVETMFPFKSALNVSGTVIGSGEELENYISKLYALPVNEFNKQFTEDLQEIKSRNTLDALHFANSVLSYGASDRFLDQAINVADIATIVSPALKLATRGGKAVANEFKALKAARDQKADFVVDSKGNITRPSKPDFITDSKGVTKAYEPPSDLELFAQALKSTVKSLKTKNLKAEDVLAAAGKTETAAFVSVLKDLKAKFYSRDPNHLATSLLKEMPSFMNPSKFFGGEFQTARELSQRILTKAENRLGAMLSVINNKTMITTLSDSALTRAFQLAKDEVRSEFTHLNDSILDIVEIAPDEATGGVGYLRLELGRPGGELFENRNQANYWLKNEIKIPGAEIMGNGDGYKIAVIRPVREDQLGLKGFLTDTENTTPKSLANTFLGWLRSADDVLSEGQRKTRKIYAHGTQEIARMLESVAQDISSLSNASAKRFERFTTDMRNFTYRGEDGEKLRGREFNTLGEFEEAWQESFESLPTAAETSAYLAYQQLNQFDYFVRNLSIYRFKARQGIRHYSFFKGVWLEGRSVKDIPWDNSEQAGVLVMDEAGGAPMFILKNFANKAQKELLEESVRSGYRVVQLANPLEKPFEEFTNGIVHFVVTKQVESRNLPFQQIPYRPGGHVVYDYPWFIKQARLSKHEETDNWLYEGDLTVHPVTTEAEGRILVKNYGIAQQLYKAGDKAVEFAEHVSKNLPWTPEELAKRFASGILSVDTPLALVARGSSSLADPTVAARYPNVRSWNNSSYNLTKGMNKEFAGTRNWDVNAVSSKYDEDHPVFELDKPRLLDTLSTINRATGRMIRNEYLEPYKIRSAESFVEEFASVLKPSLDELRKDPIGHLFEPEWNERTVDRVTLAAAKNFQRSVMSLMGVRTPFQRNWGVVQQRLMNTVYNKLGQGASDWVYERFISRTTDPVKFARQIAFHSKLGLFNPVQLFLQAQTFVHTMALSPVQAVRSLPATVIMRMLEGGGRHVVEDKFLNQYAKWASSFGWKEDDFKEAYRYMRRSGIFNVAGEHAWKNDMLDPQTITGKSGKWLDKATFFFKEGERFNRLAAFNTAYLEWRKANPFAKFDRKAQEAVMLRQDTLSVNMTKASNASWQKGFASIPTQFFSYQQRLAEQFLGKRLTKTEKLQALSIYSAMYGVPIAGGAATMVPFYQEVQQTLLEKGIETDGTVWESVVHGIPQTALNWALGTDVNWAERYGPAGLQQLRDVWYGDVSMWEIALGASGNIIGDILKTSQPFMYDVMELSNAGSEAMPLIGQDFIDALSNVSTINNAWRMIYGLNAGKVMSKGEVYLDDVNTQEAILMGIFGVSPSDLSDVRLMIQSNKTHREAQKFAEDQVIKYFRRMAKTNDLSEKRMYGRMMKVWLKLGGFRVDQLSRIYSSASDGHQDLIGRIQESFIENAPIDEQEARRNQLFNEMRQEKN